MERIRFKDYLIDYLEYNNITNKDFANRIDITPKHLIDILSGQKLQIPNRKKLYKLLEKIRIYTFIKSKNNSPEAYKLLAKQYNIRISQVKSAVNRVEQLLNEHNNIEEDKKKWL